MLTFNVNVPIPQSVIEQIGEKIKLAVREEMHSMAYIYNQYSEIEIVDAERRIDRAIKSVMGDEIKIFDGWKLDKREALMVSTAIRNRQKFAAIKEFRTHTGANLRDAKNVIDKFVGPNGAEEFEAAFI